MPNGNSSPLKIYLLDVGTEKYGDCIICELGERRILIDGAHSGDWQSRGDRPSIPEQMKEVFGHDQPFKFDLLVVTHCHADHIGCLPTLVSKGIITADAALVADEKLGFGRSQDFVPPSPDALTAADKLAAALREEDYTHLNDEDLAQVLADVATLESRYGAMLAKLQHDKTQIVRYGTGDHTVIEKKFKDFGLKVLGPTKAHLQVCAKAIAGFNGQAPSDVARAADTDLVTMYRAIVERADAAGTEDKPGKGAALNDQSIVLQLNAGGATALLAGDMQFAKPEITGLDKLMTQLRAKVKKAGPYRFIKLTHHSSYNGFDDTLLREWSPTTHFAHTGGLNDAMHPDPGVLQLLDEQQQQSLNLEWARTDRNGKITVTFPSGGPDLGISFGKLNDPTPNTDAVEAGAPAVVPAQKPTATGAQWEIPVRAGRWKVLAKMESDGSRFTITFDVNEAAAPGGKAPAGGTEGGDLGKGGILGKLNYKLASGRQLPKLLFVTYRPRLENNLGVGEAAGALKIVQDGGQTLYEVQKPDNPLPEIRAQLQKERYVGVVVLGGYDVLPSQRLNVVPQSLRSEVQPSSDADQFIVWNDEAYGDTNGDHKTELPVSRIPDGKTPRLVLAALTTTSVGNTAPRFGERNVARPFAAGPYGLLPGTAALLVSQPASPASVGAQGAAAQIVYFMLHGSDEDATRFWGEDGGGGAFEAVNITNVPRVSGAVVFAGCCWGALTVDRKASATTPGLPLGIRTSGQSMALSYLHAGARAFVGCTGTHYSPTEQPYNYFGGPMHQAFFKRLLAGAGPAQALFQAKADYRSGLPHGQDSGVGKAIEYKIWKEFTCLGLGW